MTRREKMMHELDEDIRAHIEIETQDNIARGMNPANARHAAMKKFGNVARVQEETRKVWTLVWLENFLQDARYGLRSLRKTPGFTAIAVLTLALGIGANAAIFSVVYAVLLRPLPYHDAVRLVVMHETTPKVGKVGVSYPNFEDWRAQSKTIPQMAQVTQVGFTLTGATQAETVSGFAVTPDFLSMLGVQPALGRDFSPDEGKAGAAPVVLLSYERWQSQFGGAPDAVGKTMNFDGRGFTIIGVLPANFRLLESADFLEPMGIWLTDNKGGTERGERGDANAVGRLAPGVTLQQATAEMTGIAARLAEQYPDTNDKFGVAVNTLRDEFVGDARPAVLVLFGAVVFVLLIACANVANLFLVRSASRGREIALRYAFGAGRGRIARQMLTESLLLSVCGGLLGLALAFGGIRLISQFIPADMLGGATLGLNAPVLLFAGVVVLLAAVGFGMAPAMQGSHPDLQSGLKEGAKTSSASTRQNRLRGALAVLEISLALVLLCGAGLLMKSLYKLMAVDPGFHTEQLMSAAVDISPRQYPDAPSQARFAERLVDNLRQIPGVESAAVGTAPPLFGYHSRSDISIEGMGPMKRGDYPHPDFHKISPGFTETLRIPLVAGRTFTAADNETAPKVCLINSQLAQKFFAHGDAVGRRITFDERKEGSTEWITIVGVVGDTKMYGLANPARLEIYLPFEQGAESSMNIMLRSAVDPVSLTAAIRNAVASIDKDQPVYDFATMTERASKSVGQRRVTLVLLELFSALALVLAGIGIYGVISYSVAQRTHEIGIRAALGAQRKDLLRMVLSQGVALALIGVAAGTIAALAAGRAIASLLFSVSAYDPATFAAVAATLVVVAAAACYFPARRAMRVDPMVALRYE
jgi:putative ABC transport system permease protein